MIRTIIVDDELLAGVGIRTLIDGKEDIRVEEVFSEPEEAVEYLRENPVDVVITDIEMGAMSGLDFIRIIRKEMLASGIIILSCHADFSYAQEAISEGTDSYLLKHSISGSSLISEIKKVFAKHHKDPVRQIHRQKPEKTLTGKEIYLVAVLRLAGESAGTEHHVDTVMLTNLLEQLVAKYDMGTLFSEYKKELFILLQFEPDTTAAGRKEKTEEYLGILTRSILQFTGCSLQFGLSREAVALKDTREAYAQAVRALESSFFQPGKNIFYYRETVSDFFQVSFETVNFLQDDGMNRFTVQLDDYLKMARLKNLEVSALRSQFLHGINRLILEISTTYAFSEELKNRWKNDPQLGIAVAAAPNVEVMREKILENLEEFYTECRSELKKDNLSVSLTYIENHLAEKMNLIDLADLSCMSIPSFSKRFKERTGCTLVNYINDRRIERAKILLQDEKLSLDEIAEQTGFSTANYLIRVFKKSTGQTISEFRK